LNGRAPSLLNLGQQIHFGKGVARIRCEFLKKKQPRHFRAGPRAGGTSWGGGSAGAGVFLDVGGLGLAGKKGAQNTSWAAPPPPFFAWFARKNGPKRGLQGGPMSTTVDYLLGIQPLNLSKKPWADFPIRPGTLTLLGFLRKVLPPKTPPVPLPLWFFRFALSTHPPPKQHKTHPGPVYFPGPDLNQKQTTPIGGPRRHTRAVFPPQGLIFPHLRGTTHPDQACRPGHNPSSKKPAGFRLTTNQTKTQAHAPCGVNFCGPPHRGNFCLGAIPATLSPCPSSRFRRLVVGSNLDTNSPGCLVGPHFGGTGPRLPKVPPWVEPRGGELGAPSGGHLGENGKPTDVFCHFGIFLNVQLHQHRFPCDNVMFPGGRLRVFRPRLGLPFETREALSF